MKKHYAKLVQAVPLLVAFVPFGSVVSARAASTTTAKNKTLVLATEQQQPSADGFAAFGASPELVSSNQMVSIVKPAMQLQPLATGYLQQHLHKNNLSGSRQGLFTDVRTSGDKTELLQNVGACSFGTCLTGTPKAPSSCVVDADCFSSDTAPPVVSSINRSGSPAANVTSMAFVVTFNESASNVSPDDFQLTGTATGNIASVSATTGSSITVTINSISGAGTLRLDLKASTNIKDSSNNGGGTNGYVNAYTSGQTHTVDLVAPLFQNSTPSLSGTTDSATTLAVRLNETGTAYYVVVADGAAAPSAAQVKAGQNNAGAAALKSGSLNISNNSTDFTANITALTAGTSYDVYVVAQDSATNLQASASKVDVTTQTLSPTISSATYDASTGVLTASGSNITNNGVIDVSKLTLTGEGGSTYTLTSANVNASGSSSFSVTLNATDRNAVQLFLNKAGTSSTSGTTYNLAAADDWDSAVTAGNTADLTGNGITVSNVAVPVITSATYNASTGTLSVTGSGFLAKAGAINDIDASSLTFTGEGGTTVTLTDTADVEVLSNTAFTLVLSSNDQALLNQYANKNGTASTSGTTYNLAAAEDWAAGADSAAVIADLTGNGVTVSGVVTPELTSATYNAATGALALTGTSFLRKSGASNDIDASMLTLTVEGGATYTLTDTLDVDISSATAASLTLSSSDRAALATLVNKNGTASTGGTTYNVAAADDWATGADTALFSADLTGNGIMVSNVAVPTITSATYNAATGVLAVTGTGLLALAGANNDIDISKFQLSGDGAAHSLTSSSVEISSATGFSVTLNGTDTAALTSRINKNGTSSALSQTYNLAASEDWNAGADVAVAVADLTGNGITASNIPPSVAAVSASTANGSYKAGDIISIELSFNEAVTVTGTPQLTLETGSTDQLVNYSAGSGTTTLTFNYAVQAGDSSSDLDYLSVNALSLNGGSIKNGGAVDAVLALPAPGTAGSLGANKALLIDTAAPSVSNVTGATADGSYNTGDVISLQVSFSENVTVTGTPQLTLETGAVDRSVNYASGSGSSTLVFNYTVQAGDASNDLDYLSSNALSLNGGTIVDAAGNSSVLTLAAPGTAGSLGNNKAYLIDAVVPTVTAAMLNTAAPADASISYQLTFSETVSNIDMADFSLNSTGTAAGTASAVSASSGGSVTVTVNNISGTGSLRLDHVSSNIVDAAGNALAAYNSAPVHQVDRDRPVITSVIFDQNSIDATNENSASFTLTGAETATTANYSISSSSGGTPVTGSVAVTNAGQTISGVNLSSLGDGTLTLSLTLTDAAGNVSTPAVIATTLKDSQIPQLSQISVANGNYKAGQVLTFTVTFNDTVVVTGTDSTLAIMLGSTSRQASFVSSNGNSLTYSYTVQAGDNTDQDGVKVPANGLTLNSTTIKDSGDNTANLNFAQRNNSAAKVDTQTPAVAVVTRPAQAVFVNADNFTVTGTHAENAVVVHLYADSNNDGVAEGSSLASSDVVNGLWSIPRQLQADTAHNFVVLAEDAAGNQAVAVDVPTITEDSQTPVLPVVTVPAAALVLNADNQLISGSHAENGVIVELFADTDNNGIADNDTVLATATVANGNWSMTAVLSQSSSNYFVVRAKDAASNQTVAVNIPDITEDSQSPVVSLNPLSTNLPRPAFSGTVNDAAAVISVTVNGQSYTAQNNGSSWLIPANTIVALPNGVYQVSVVATDALNNASTPVTAQLTVDLQAPQGYSAAIEQNRINKANETALSFLLQGGEIGSSYSYTLSDGSNSISGSGDISTATQRVGGINVSSLAEGTLTLSLVLTDPLGNRGTAVTSTVLKRYNTAPVLAAISGTTVEDEQLRLTLVGQDGENDSLSYQVQTQPQHGTVTVAGNELVYTPAANYHGADSLVLLAKDAELSSAPATVQITVTAVNDAPVAQDDRLTQAKMANDQYLLAVLTNDSDVDGDSLTIDGVQADVGIVRLAADGLRFTAPLDYVGPVTLRYTLIDGKGGRASALVNLLIEGSRSSAVPVITVPADVTANAQALFTRVDVGTATAVDSAGAKLKVALVNNSLFFAPGAHLVYWQATDAQGNIATKSQAVNVKPLISLSKEQTVTEGNAVVVQVLLNGQSPVYPVQIPYTVTGTAGGNDHTLVNAVVEISQGLSAELRFQVLEDGTAEEPETVIITLDPALNRGSQAQTTIRISEQNIAPAAALQVSQAGENRLTLSQAGGVATIEATVSDANPADQLSGSWMFADLVGASQAGNKLSFDPAQQAPGVYPVSYTVQDNGSPQLQATAQVFVVIQPSLPLLTDADADGDLIPDNSEGFADGDGDGIPDYLDAINECNVVPAEGQQQVSYLAEGEPGVCLRRGSVAVLSDSGGLQVKTVELQPDSTANNIGGIFDFIAYGLPVQGQSYNLVLPQRNPVPSNAVYRKFTAAGGWVDFVSNARNSVTSTAGERGFCPPPGDSRWTPGLTEGHWCVQVTVEDGGPNDADGIANSAIVDPGGVAVAANGNKLPVAVADTLTTPINQAAVVNVLANDSDADGDVLTITQAVGSFGALLIQADKQLLYTPKTDFFGTDVVVYSVTDGKGGTTSAELTVTVLNNNAPVLSNDTAATDDRTALRINVLANDTDPDGNPLTLISATAQQGTVTVQDKQLTYVPKAAFNGVDTIRYLVQDNFGAQAAAEVKVTVKAYQEVMVVNQSRGGSLSPWWLGGLAVAALMFRRRQSKALLAGALLLLSPLGHSADWYLQGSYGQSKADIAAAEFQSQLPAGNILSFDAEDQFKAVQLGYQWYPAVAVELGYLDSGEGQLTLKGDSLTPEQYHQQVKAFSPTLADGITLGLRLTPWQQGNWRLEVPFGLIRWDSEISSQRGATELRTKFDGQELYFALDLHYQFSTNLSAGIGYQKLKLAPNDVANTYLQLRYRF